MAVAENIYAVILAGGSGTRFWPKSRQKSPKQLCSIGSTSETMIETTLHRLDGFIPAARRMIVTHREQIDSTRSIVGDRCKYFLAEPDARNTANALALAALELKSMHKGKTPPIMISLHADHVIKDVAAFKKSLENGIETAKEGFITLLGIVPEYPETGYGYIEKGKPINKLAAEVASFREKPQRTLAEQYIKAGNFFWNAGIFVWDVNCILEELHQYLAPTIERLGSLLKGPIDSFTKVDSKVMEEAYSQLPKISIDHAVLELSHKVAVIEAAIGWQDVGTWDALAKCFPKNCDGNISYGDTILIDCHQTTVDTDGDLVACVGLHNLIVVKSKGAILVCDQNRAQDVKQIVGHLQENGRSEYL